ncbi:MAG TPA: inorganic phosphate transporter [Pyrinomonadaceae bacterium]
MAAANGANDNGKGIATLAGAGVTSHRKALWWAQGSTLVGALLSGIVASRMLKLFSSGIVSAEPTPAFTVAVLIGAASWAAVATSTNLNYLLGTAPECICLRATTLAAGAVEIPQLTVVQASIGECRAHNNFSTLNVNYIHWLSSGLVGVARGLNDAPKIVAIALAAGGATGISQGVFQRPLLSLAMFAGGLAGRAWQSAWAMTSLR